MAAVITPDKTETKVRAEAVRMAALQAQVKGILDTIQFFHGKATEAEIALETLVGALPASTSTDTFVIREHISTGAKEGVKALTDALGELAEASGIIFKAMLTKNPDALLSDPKWVEDLQTELEDGLKKVIHSMHVGGESAKSLGQIKPTLEGPVRQMAEGIYAAATGNMDAGKPVLGSFEDTIDSLQSSNQAKLNRARKELLHTSTSADHAFSAFGKAFAGLSPDVQGQLGDVLHDADDGSDKLSKGLLFTSMASGMDENDPRFKETVCEAYRKSKLGQDVSRRALNKTECKMPSFPPKDKAALEPVVRDAKKAIESGNRPLALLAKVLKSLDVDAEALLSGNQAKLDRATEELERTNKLAISSTTKFTKTFASLSPDSKKILADVFKGVNEGMNGLTQAIICTAYASGMNETDPDFKGAVSKALKLAEDSKKISTEALEKTESRMPSLPPKDRQALEPVLREAKLSISSGEDPINLLKEVLGSLAVTQDASKEATPSTPTSPSSATAGSGFLGWAASLVTGGASAAPVGSTPAAAPASQPAAEADKPKSRPQ